MFDFDAFEKELDEQNLALESMIAEMDIAQEGLFKPKSLDQMLSKVQKQVNKKCKSVDACDDLLAKLKGEEAKFNSSLKTMKNAALQFKADGDKKALKAAIGPASKELKKTCNIINLNDVVDDNQDVTDADIKKLHDFLVGTRKIINEKKKALKSSGAMEGMTDMDYTDFDLYLDAAMEAKFTKEKLEARNNGKWYDKENSTKKNSHGSTDPNEKKKGKLNNLGAIQAAQRHLAQTCYKMADRCKRMAKGKDSGFWNAAYKFFDSMCKRLKGRLTPEQLKTCEEKCDEWKKRVDKKKKETKENSSNDESAKDAAATAAESMTLYAMEQALGDIRDELAQCSSIAIEMELSMSDDFDYAMESFDVGDFVPAMEADCDKKEDKKDKKEKSKGGIQSIKRTLATHCYKMAQRCKRLAGDEKMAANKGIFAKLYKLYTRICQNMKKNLSADQLAKYRDAVATYDKEVQEAAAKKAKKAAAKANESFLEEADYTEAGVFAAFEQSMSTIYDGLSQWYDIAVEMELSDMEDMFDDDLALSMESESDFDLDDDDDDSDFGMESYSDPYLAFAEVAMEGLGQDIKDNWKLKHGEVRKECKENLKKARAAKKAGNMKEAIKYANAAKKGFMGLKAVANKLPATSMKGATKTNALKWADKQIAACDKFIAKCKGTPAKESFFDFDDDDFAMESAEEILGVYDDFDEDVIL